MDATLINSFPETLKYVQKNNVIESVSSIELSNSIILNEILDFSKIIKTIGILFIIATFNLIFPYEDNKDSFNYKLYITLLFILLAYIIYTNELYITVGVFIFVAIFIIPLLIVLYIYLEKNETINIIFYSYNNQLKNVFSNNFNNYELIFNIFFISIIFILSIVLYWDNVYADAKKISKCGQILQIIEENTYKKKPYVYNIIIIDNDSLDINISNYIIKITYDFIKMKTIIEYVKYNTVIYYTDDEIKVKYFNLRNMDVDTIENINPIIFNSPEKYKYLCVDENNNPIYNYSSKELIKFTKNYAKEQDYNPSIIYDIIYAKINNDKVFT
jgi:hypothetical protein